jgi:4-methylaminobutanoate oxidase (formaldehyde-forming)
MRRHLGDLHAFVADATAGYAQINVQGPRSRELLQKVTTADLSDGAFPFRTARHIDLGFARVLCARITYVGELGYELFIPAEQAVDVYDRLVAAGEGLGLTHAGLKALSSLRMEKGYRDFGHDMDNTDGVWEVGLGHVVDLSKESFVRRRGGAGDDRSRRAHLAGISRRRDVDGGHRRPAVPGGGLVGPALRPAGEEG